MTAISRSRGRRAVRTVLAVGAASLGLSALTGCGEKPTPNAHFTLGSSTSSPEAEQECYGHGEALGAEQAQACMESFEDVTTFHTQEGDTFRVGVDPSVADTGWLLFVNGRTDTPEPSTTTYRSMDADELYERVAASLTGLEEDQETAVQLSLVQVTEDYSADAVLEANQLQDLEAFNDALFGEFEGVWNVRLEPKDD